MSRMVYIRVSVSRMEPKIRRSALFLKGALVGVAYYVGALVGFALKFPSHSPSALWPPNSILLAALLCCRRGNGGSFFLGAFPAHLLVQLPRGVPVVMSLAFFLSNSCEALLGAFLIRRSIDGPLRFDSLKSAGVFVLAAVVVAPFLSSFLDAGFVTLIGWQEASYWQVWRERLPSNALAALAIPPVIVLWANDGPAWLQRVSTRQRVEALIMIGGLLAVSALVFAWEYSRRDATPALLFLPLPFLLWAALRFGPPATSASLLILIFVSIWGAAKGLRTLCRTLADAKRPVPANVPARHLRSVDFSCRRDRGAPQERGIAAGKRRALPYDGGHRAGANLDYGRRQALHLCESDLARFDGENLRRRVG
jgi:Predicted integral membrane sensor domain